MGPWFADKVALVAGGGPLADAIAARLSEAGASVTGSDSLDPSEVARDVEQVLTRFGRLDFLVTCPGPWCQSAVESLDPEVWNAALTANLTSAFLWCRAAAEPVKRAGGRVVTFASDDGFRGRRNGAHYAAAMAGVVGLTKVLAAELSPGATANVVALGPMDGGVVTDPDPSGPPLELPMGRRGTPADAAGAAMFLLGPDAGWVAGQVLHLNGGEFTP
jgi:NAD(P)-dependent dehydrogenase (short-subunit alcohol dehydrogenase family)